MKNYIKNKISNILDKVKTFLSKNLSQNKYVLQDKHEFKPMLIEIEERPINPIGNFILWSVIVIFFIVIAWLSFSKIDVVVTANGMLIPNGSIKKIQFPYRGTIQEILVETGDHVSEGEVLLKIDTTVIEEEIKRKSQQLRFLGTKIKRIKSQISNDNFVYKKFMDKNDFIHEKKIFNNEHSKYQEKKKILDEQIVSLREKIKLENINKNIDLSKLLQEQEMLKNLMKVSELVPKIQIVNTKSKIYILKEQIKSYKNKKNILYKTLEEVTNKNNLLKMDADSINLNRLDGLISKTMDLRSELNTLRTKKNQYDIKSPVDGYILVLNTNTKNGVISPAQEVITIVPNDVNIIAKVDVLNKDIGFIKDNMDSVIKVATFNFQKYGLVNAKVKKISTSSVDKKNYGPIYEVTLLLDKSYLIYKGNKKYLKPGMSISAEMKVGKRRMIEFFLYPAIKHINEGMSIL